MLSAMARRPATADEAKALAHPLRMRILRLCLDEALTNRQLADRLGKDPATVLHHVRRLHATGFLAAAPERTGKRGAREKPYQATGKSWTLDIGVDVAPHGSLAMLDAHRAEMLEAGPDAVTTSARFRLRLTDADLADFLERTAALFEEFVGRENPSGGSYGFLFSGHRNAGGLPVRPEE